MGYENKIVRSADDLPIYTDVEHEIVPLGLGPVDACMETLTLESMRLHIERFRTRLWFQEVQHGETLYLSLILPGSAPVRFNRSTLRAPMVLGWHGLSQQHWDYVIEPGTLHYMLEVPLESARARGWILPPPETLFVESSKAEAFTQFVDAVFALPNNAGELNAVRPKLDEDILFAFDQLTDDQLYGFSATYTPKARIPAQQSLVKRAFEYLDTFGQSEDISVPQMASALSTSSRSLFAAFEAQLGIGPRKLHHIRRLYRLRHELIAESPETATVSKLMNDCGFFQLGRTAGSYQTHFGEKPSDTLRREQ